MFGCDPPKSGQAAMMLIVEPSPGTSISLLSFFSFYFSWVLLWLCLMRQFSVKLICLLRELKSFGIKIRACRNSFEFPGVEYIGYVEIDGPFPLNISLLAEKSK
jgi:hypothetical protein